MSETSERTYSAEDLRAVLKIQLLARRFTAFLRLHARANALVEKILEPVQTKLYEKAVFYYYHTVLKTVRCLLCFTK